MKIKAPEVKIVSEREDIDAREYLIANQYMNSFVHRCAFSHNYYPSAVMLQLKLAITEELPNKR